MSVSDWRKVYEQAVKAIDQLDEMAFTFPADDVEASPFLREYSQAMASAMTVRDWARQRMASAVAAAK
jgi:hypothetical protein